VKGPANAPGSLTVTDFASHYDVNPVYHSGVSGKGVAIGIVTFASFTPSDAYAYWHALGLNVSSSRIHEVQIDGGFGPVSDLGGSLETTLDVEQSGGLSPGSKVMVYEGPNTDQGFIDAFAKAVDSNTADTISCSWGEWEFFDLASQGNIVTDPVTGRTAATIRPPSSTCLTWQIFCGLCAKIPVDSRRERRPMRAPFTASPVRGVCDEHRRGKESIGGDERQTLSLGRTAC
jgi:hypothetical protein